MSLIFRTAMMMGTITIGGVSLAGYSHPAGQQPLEQHPARVVMPPEPIRSTPKSDRLTLFDHRWDQMPTVAEIRTIPLEKPSLPIVRPEGQDPPGEPEVKTRRRHVEERESQERREERPKNVCERHHLRKVTTHGGRSWRCRR
jgi:hypothetical protein